ncbi:MAG: phosphatase PAP2 family protein [Novosphingobium sp.]|nr:phosphatase PAP2 family protein [Novosphingobium sp.]MCP5403113.1 phosphatase PAP2 family protein [Novosphingobium sp.]
MRSTTVIKEREWIVPAILLTVVTGIVALSFIPNSSGLIPALNILPAWMAAAAVIGSITAILSMAARGVSSPVDELRSVDRRRAVYVTSVILLAGLNMIAFMWMKPLLNYLVPFWADPMLANLDHAIFLGHDPWKLFAWLNFPWSGLVYHQFWFAMMILMLLVVAIAPPSPQKSAVMLSYFLLWSIVGPVIHTLMPAAGPIFYERMGYGGRFDGLAPGPETQWVADYLWSIYSSESFGAGSGISAMPSMHVTITVWMMIAVWMFARQFVLPALVAGSAIFLLSISLGWHYAIDGIAGAVAAVGCFLIALLYYRKRCTKSEEPEPEAPSETDQPPGKPAILA